MCGITGWINLKSSKSPNEQNEAILHGMCERIVHRGPNSEGIWMDATVALGMRRLSVIDLETGDQPVFSADKSVVVMMNGELYNYREVRADLEKRGHKFITRSDTEILPHLYEEYGEDLVDHLNGMYAFSLWDTRKKKLIIARDRFGEKPLYYGVFDEKLIYASEPKAILAHPSVTPELDLDALRQYLSYDYVPAPKSIYKGISKLPAAHILTVENSAIKTRRYWNQTFAKNGHKPSLENSAAELKELLSDAVRMRLVSDVPLGILLSGGVDSSTVAAFAVQHATERVKTFSIGFEEDSFDESKYARMVAKHLSTDHHEDKLNAATAGELISEIGTWLDEPMSDASLIPTYLLAKFVRRHVTVALGGDGGDEIFAGYPTYFAHKVTKGYMTIPRFLRSGVIEPVVRSLPVSTNYMSFDFKAKRFIRGANFGTVKRHYSWFGSFALEEQEQLLLPEVLAATDKDIYRGPREMLSICDASDEIEQMQFLDMNFYLAEDILTKVDRAAMAVSLETRAPFLDPRVAKFAAGLPLDYKLSGKKGKFILKKAVEGLLPKEILNRPKKGFGVPVAEWLKGKLNPMMHDLLAPDRLRSQGLFEPAYVESLVREHETGRASHHKQLWTLLVFQLWYDNFLQPK